MSRPCLALALLTVGCGQVAHQQPDAGADAAVDATPAVAYHGTLAATPAKPFGGPPYCDYTITLKQLAVDLMLIPQASGGALVAAGHVEALNHEATDPSCPNATIPDGIAKYDFAPPSPVSSSTALTFTGDAANAPHVALSVTLTQAGTVYQANLGFHRTDSTADSLNWTVVATVALTAQ